MDCVTVFVSFCFLVSSALTLSLSSESSIAIDQHDERKSACVEAVTYDAGMERQWLDSESTFSSSTSWPRCNRFSQSKWRLAKF